MKSQKKSGDKKMKAVRLAARILSVPIVVYSLVMIAGYLYSWITTGTADPNAVEDYPFIENLPPVFLLVAALGLVVAWFREKVGALINIFFCLAVVPILLIHWPFWEDSGNLIPYFLTLVVGLPGILFFISGKSMAKK